MKKILSVVIGGLVAFVTLASGVVTLILAYSYFFGDTPTSMRYLLISLGIFVISLTIALKSKTVREQFWELFFFYP